VKEPLFEMSLLPQAVSARERTYHRQSGSNSQLLLSGPVTHPMKEDVKEKASPRLSEFSEGLLVWLLWPAARSSGNANRSCLSQLDCFMKQWCPTPFGSEATQAKRWL